MQTPTRTTLSGAKIFAVATALLVASVLVINKPRTANAASAFGNPSVQPSATTVHDGTDWSRVAATPVDTGATVGAYNR